MSILNTNLDFLRRLSSTTIGFLLTFSFLAATSFSLTGSISNYKKNDIGVTHAF